MTSVALFHPVLGIRQGTLDAAEQLRADGHDVLVPDLFEGPTFDDYEPALAFANDELGHAVMLQRAAEAVSTLPDGFVSAGFSLGCVMAVHVAMHHAVSGVVMIGGAIPPSAFGEDVGWPQGVHAQTHSTVQDPWREQDEIDATRREVEASGGRLEVFDYPGTGHLFTEPTLPDEFDAAATELMWSRVLPFVRNCGCILRPRLAWLAFDDAGVSDGTGRFRPWPLADRGHRSAERVRASTGTAR